MTRYLSDSWGPIIEKDVDGPNSLPARIDAEVSNLGKYSATRRVARTIYLGSAPLADAANRGLEDRRIKLGSVMPEETPALFGDALRRLASSATYLYQDSNRYWYSTQPTVTKMAEDRAAQLSGEPDKVVQEIEERLRKGLEDRAEFSRIHALPQSGSDVPDDRDTRLVVLGPDHPHSRSGESAALRFAKEIFETRGAAGRQFRNSLVFLAVDKTRLQDLDEATRKFLAWSSIVADVDSLDLSQHQIRQAKTQLKTAEQSFLSRIPEAFHWLLFPSQTNPDKSPEWQAIRVSGADTLAARLSKRLKSDENLIATYNPSLLRMELDRVPLWRGNHVAVGQILDDYASYMYLPRITRSSVLVETIKDGIALQSWEQDGFAYADRYDDEEGRYQALRANQSVALSVDDLGLLVKPEIARAQMDSEVVDESGPEDGPGVSDGPGDRPGPGPDTGTRHDTAPQKLRRYHGSVQLDSMRVGRDADVIADEVISHLVGLVGSDVRVSLEIEADVPGGVPDSVVRIVTENGNSLKFDSHGFEES